MSRIRSTILLALVAAVCSFAAPAEASFPGKNGKFVFDDLCCRPPNFDTYIFTMNGDGTDLRQLPWPSTVSDAAHPAWSPDGKRIAFIGSTRAGALRPSQVWTMDADGGNPQQVTHITRPVDEALAPAWSPDGKQIVYMGGDRHVPFTGLTSLWIVGADGSDDHILPIPDKDLVLPSDAAWSPRGDRIAFAAYSKREPGRNLYTIRPDGTELTQITRTGNDDGIGAPSWSPDGQFIAFERSGFPAPIYWVISVIRPDGTGLRTVFEGARIPTWSPDGTKLSIHCCFQGEMRGIATINADGTGLHGIPGSDQKSPGEHDDWQPIPGPKRSDYKNSNQFCKAEQAFWGDQFASRYGGGANAFGKCASRSH
jgi:dipeptidyl aminopeptidase/acylaminoacyl peptidase